MSFRTLRGMKDVLPDEAEKWRLVEETARRVFESFGFREIRIPLLEPTELFSRSIGEASDIVSKEMYTFKDRKGRSISLRPEGTAGVVRAYLQHKMDNFPSPVKLYYLGSMYRYERPQAGRYREHSQIGVEALGSGNPALDAELIYLAFHLFEELSVKDLRIEINTVGCFKCRPRYIRALKKSLEGSLKDLCEDCRRRYMVNPLRILDCKNTNCRRYISKAPALDKFLCPSCSKHFKEVRRYLDGLKIRYSIQPSLVRGFDYYTRTAFEVVSGRLGGKNVIAGGGRYDRLVEDMGGPSTPAVGFSFGVERTLMKVRMELSHKPPLIYLISIGGKAFDEGFMLLSKLREKGIRAEMDYQGRSLRGQMRVANKLKAKYVLIMGKEELERGNLLLKDMQTGKQDEMDKKKVMGILVERLGAKGA